MNVSRPEEEAVVKVGLSRGYFTQAQLDQIRVERNRLQEPGRPTTILPLLGTLLDPLQQSEL